MREYIDLIINTDQTDDSPSNRHSTTSAPQDPKANSNLGFKEYSASRRLSSRSLTLPSLTGLGLVVLNAGMDDNVERV